MGVPRRRQLATVWLGSVALLGAVVAASTLTLTGGDDRDPARQRPGILDLGVLPVPAPDLRGIETSGEKTTVVFFAGRNLRDFCRELRGRTEELAAEVIVVTERGDPCGAATTIKLSPTESAEAYGLANPRDGGAPLGYAIIDRTGQIRYRTLDPVVATMFQEVETMLRAIG